jgi:hypothetical protein
MTAHVLWPELKRDIDIAGRTAGPRDYNFQTQHASLERIVTVEERQLMYR